MLKILNDRTSMTICKNLIYESIISSFDYTYISNFYSILQLTLKSKKSTKIKIQIVKIYNEVSKISKK